MSRFSKKKPCFIFIIYLSLSLTGACTFSLAETLHSMEMKNPVESENLISYLDYDNNWLMEDTPVIIQDEKLSPYSARSGSIRELMPYGMHDGQAGTAEVLLKTEGINFLPERIPPIHPKLRI